MRFFPVFLGACAWLTAHGAAAEVIRIGTLPGLRFDLSEFSVQPGAEVEVIISNSDEMLHNFVVTKPGRRLSVVEAALALGTGAADREYVPDSTDVLWASKVVPSGQSSTLKFTAPADLGEYPYVCTFPGHGYVMFGKMIVTPKPRPPVRVDPALPSANSAAEHTNHAGHEAPLTRAEVIRFFMPDSGPASIAVRLPGGYSYCWDAGACRFRYAWKGGTIERGERGTAKILGGEVFYRGERDFPLRLGLEPNVMPAEIEFKGYVLDANGVPEFEYEVDHVTVRERIEIADGQVTRRFRTNGKTIWFSVPSETAPHITTDGVREGEFHKFTGASAREFVITYTPSAN